MFENDALNLKFDDEKIRPFTKEENNSLRKYEMFESSIIEEDTCLFERIINFLF